MAPSMDQKSEESDPVLMGHTTQPRDLKIGSLHRLIDAQWHIYLNRLDDYTTAQAVVQRNMTAGFLSLAQANFQSSGRRYGQDYYDQRAVAATRVKLQYNSDSDHHSGVEIVKHVFPQSKKDAPETSRVDLLEMLAKTTLDEPQEGMETVRQTTSNDKTHEEKQPSEDSQAQVSPDTSEDSSPKPPLHPHDPIRWFGILVPPSLRTAQTFFSSAVFARDGMTTAVQAACDMRIIEADIRRLRKELKKIEKSGASDFNSWQAPPHAIGELQEVDEEDVSLEEVVEKFPGRIAIQGAFLPPLPLHRMEGLGRMV
ncbi:hypothetical protein DOTSEDRAFT_75408 [Dothistroma septosporum NZE10]|uniref:Vacuolar ATPase assembly protein VMA22 n=1 Tax=Dothistroma septosporum (strain NZE10 / CBS 128990) TaxID=675120 RepID=M2XGM1_DOTSN|nr:hypothetical protein DOTSEDRAFT_75408 [Dothistroma septosporum NZE10]